MIESQVVEVDGVFVGAAILRAEHGALSFFAIHDRVRALHGAVLPNMAALHHQARRTYRGVHSTAEAIVVSQTLCSEPRS